MYSLIWPVQPVLNELLPSKILNELLPSKRRSEEVFMVPQKYFKDMANPCGGTPILDLTGFAAQQCVLLR